MKPSRYNHFVPVDGKLYAFNCLTERFFPVPDGREETYRELLENPDLYEKDFATFYNKMRPAGFILADDTDEMAIVRQKYEGIRRPSEYSIMVMPTYACNLRCWYCIQEHANISLPDEYFDRLKRHFDKVVKRDDITSIKLWWFGGEPMIKYDKVLDLNLYVKRICEENDKRFSSNITTNSILLTPERVDRLRESGVNHYQISIDGPKRIHDTVKVVLGESAFEHALSIVDYIARTTSVTLRFNFTKDTLIPDEVFADVNSRLSEESRKNINFLVYKVWQEDYENIDASKISDLTSQLKHHNIQPRLATSGLCYADYKNFFCVFPNGKVDKCDNFTLESNRGSINEEGDFVWSEVDNLEIPILMGQNVICDTCSFLPVCWGPCIDKRAKMLEKHDAVHCQYDEGKTDLLHTIGNRIKNFLSEQNN